MKKIIKEGVKEFRATCPFCYCEFTYEREDVRDGMANGMVNCPDCGAILEIKACTRKINSQTKRDTMLWETPEYRELQETFKQQSSHVDCNKPINLCENCPHYLRLKAGETYVGDSPCLWCQYGGLRVTCTSTASNNSNATTETSFSAEKNE